MGKYFDDIHATKESQLEGFTCNVPDNYEAAELRRMTLSDSENYLALGDAPSKQLRFLEAIETYSEALKLNPDNVRALRSRAGRYLSTLQPDKAESDFKLCLGHGSDRLDCLYRIGLCEYYSGNYWRAITALEEAITLCDDEMGVAVIYWHTLSCLKSGEPLRLTEQYHEGMSVGHHTAYEKAVGMFAGKVTADALLNILKSEADDMEYVIALYGVCVYLRSKGEDERADMLMRGLLSRDSVWFCFSYLAAWNDAEK